jgi:hypothetical protein
MKNSLPDRVRGVGDAGGLEVRDRALREPRGQRVTLVRDRIDRRTGSKRRRLQERIDHRGGRIGFINMSDELIARQPANRAADEAFLETFVESFDRIREVFPWPRKSTNFASIIFAPCF